VATLRQTLPPRRAQVQYAPEMELGYDMLGAMTPGRMTPGRSPGMTPSRMSRRRLCAAALSDHQRICARVAS